MKFRIFCACWERFDKKSPPYRRIFLFSFAKEKDMYFSPQGEKIPKELLRLSPQTPMLLSGSVYTRLPTRVCVPQRVRKPRRNTPCGKQLRLRTPRPRAQERLPARCQQKRRRPADHASFASVDAVFHSRHRTTAGHTNDQAGGLRLLFVLFFPQRKEHVSPLSKGEDMCFSH